MLSKKDAENALEECNGMAVVAGMAEVMAMDKQKKKKVRREEKKRKEAVKVEDDQEEGKEDQDRAIEERVIAVDWALSKEKWQEERAKMDVVEEGDVDMPSVKSEEASDNGSDEDRDDEENLGLHVESGEEPDTSDEDDNVAAEPGDEKPVKPQLPPPETGTTLFVRNVPFAATEDELRTLYVSPLFMSEVYDLSMVSFRAFGPLRYARITLDPATGRSRGTGFACFWNKTDADKVVEQSDLLRSESMGGETVRLSPLRPNSRY
jgi:nucleolar protein 4